MEYLKLVRRVGLAWVAVLAIVGACTGSPELAQKGQQVGAATITTDQTNYAVSAPITASWTNLPGNVDDWIAIVPAGSPADSGFLEWHYTNGQVNGSQAFSGLQAGSYEARAYQSGSYTILASSPFTVGGGGGGSGSSVTVTTDKSIYGGGQPVTVTWAGMPGNVDDWVAIVPQGAPADSGFVEWHYTNGQVNGSQMFAGLTTGTYEARAYLAGTYTILGSTTFSVSSVTTDKQTYYVNEQVTVSWTGMPGNAQDWVTIVPAGSPADSGFIEYHYTNGQVNGSQVFAGLPAGNYEARTYLAGTYTIVGSATFSVMGTQPPPPSITTDMTSYAVNTQVTVSWAGLPTATDTWITIVPAGSPPDSGFIEYHFTNGQPSGMQVFQGLATPGTYEARAYQGGTYTVLASTTFAVTGSGGGGTCTPPSTPPVIGSINSGDLVLDATQNVNTVALTVAFANSILFTSVRESEPSPQYGGVMCTLHDVDMVNNRPAGVTCQRGAPGTDTGNGTITVHYTVVTFTSGVTVQRGIADTHTTDPQTVALTTVDPTSSFVVLNGITVLGTGWGNNEFVRAQLVDGSTLSIQTAVAGAETSWQVVTMTGASVQRGTASFATGDTQQAVAITAAPSGSMVLASYTTDNQSGIAASALMLEASLQDPSTVLLSRGSGGSNLSVSWEVVSLPFAVHSGIASFAAGQSTASASIAGISASTSVGLAAGQAILGQSGGSTTYAGSQLDLVGEAAATLVTGSGSVQLDRASTQASAEIPWQVIDFAHNCNGL